MIADALAMNVAGLRAFACIGAFAPVAGNPLVIATRVVIAAFGACGFRADDDFAIRVGDRAAA